MRNFLENLNYKLQGWMQGRYGFDALSKTMVYSSLVFFIISAIFRLTIFYSMAIVLIIWAYIRCFSRNIYARNKELNIYYKLLKKTKDKTELCKRIWHDRKTHRYFKCKNCKAVLRVPKGKGKIEITCKVCKSKMIKKT